MSCIRIAGEDELSCTFGERLVETCLPNWHIDGENINTKGVSRLWKRMHDYRQFAQHRFPVLCIADTDG
jgi:hypothetical protein